MDKGGSDAAARLDQSLKLLWDTFNRSDCPGQLGHSEVGGGQTESRPTNVGSVQASETYLGNSGTSLGTEPRQTPSKTVLLRARKCKKSHLHSVSGAISGL